MTVMQFVRLSGSTWLFVVLFAAFLHAHLNVLESGFLPAFFVF